MDIAISDLDAVTTLVDDDEFVIARASGNKKVQYRYVRSRTRDVEVGITDPNGDALTTGDGKGYFVVPASLNGWNLTAAHAAVITVSSSGKPTIQVHNLTQTADMLTTKIEIDASEHTSYTGTAGGVDVANDDVATGDILRFDIDVAGTGAKGLYVILTFTEP